MTPSHVYGPNDVHSVTCFSCLPLTMHYHLSPPVVLIGYMPCILFIYRNGIPIVISSLSNLDLIH